MSAFATLNGLDIIEAEVSIPRIGLWHADVSVDTRTLPDGQCTLSLGGFRMQCGVYRGGISQDVLTCRLTGGTGLLPLSVVPSKSYRNVTVGAVLQDLLRPSADVVSSTADKQVLQTLLPNWGTRAGPSGLALQQLLGAAWRFLPDGSLWCGPDAWTKSNLAGFEVLMEQPWLGRAKLRTLDMSLQPSTTLGTWRVSYVRHSIRGGSIETELWTE